MDLIEKLGGYEKAKGVFSRMSVCQRGCIEDKLVFFSFAGLQKALLEYRREHNIFEVGDNILFKDAWLWSTVFVIKEIITNANGETAYLVSKKIAPTADKIRHATNEEIKAGHRL